MDNTAKDTEKANSPASIEERLAEARRAKAALEKKRTDRLAAKEQDPDRQLAIAERELREAEAVEVAEAEHGSEADGFLKFVKTERGLIIVKRQHPSVVRRHLDTGKSSNVAIQTLVKGCIIFPSMDRFDEINDVLPYTLTLVGDAVIELAGFQQREQSGK